MARLGDDVLARVDARLATADRLLAERSSGAPPERQPVHTCYLPADAAGPGTPGAWGAQAGELLAVVLPDAWTAAAVTGLPVDAATYARVRRKLGTQPVEDLRLDFEDGYGERPDAEEDADAERAGATIGTLLAGGGGPVSCGVRVKCLEPATRRRGLRTLDLVLGALLAAGPLPAGFVVTLPKVTSADQVMAFGEVCATLEEAYGVPAGRLRFEVQVETPQAVLAAEAIVRAGAGRCTGLHFGTYDYTAALGIARSQQSLDHPAADHAKAVLQVAAAGTGVRLSDGSTNVLPVGTADEVAAALRLHAGLVARALVRGYPQGWDMHPGHLVTRYLATYAFYRAGLPAPGRAGVVEEPATRAALAAFLARGVQCGALDPDELP